MLSTVCWQRIVDGIARCVYISMRLLSLIVLPLAPILSLSLSLSLSRSLYPLSPPLSLSPSLSPLITYYRPALLKIIIISFFSRLSLSLSLSIYLSFSPLFTYYRPHCTTSNHNNLSLSLSLSLSPCLSLR